MRDGGTLSHTLAGDKIPARLACQPRPRCAMRILAAHPWQALTVCWVESWRREFSWCRCRLTDVQRDFLVNYVLFLFEKFLLI